MPETEKTCVACRRAIDPAARLCPFCGANPETGQRMDVKRIVESHFPPPPPLSVVERTLQFFRTRQAVSVSLIVAVGVALLLVAHQWIQQRNRSAVAPTPGVTLTEIADLSRRIEDRSPQPLPELEFQLEGDAKKMQTFVLEPGAIAPPPDAEPQQPASGPQPQTRRAPQSPPGATARPRQAPQAPSTQQQPARQRLPQPQSQAPPAPEQTATNAPEPQ